MLYSLKFRWLLRLLVGMAEYEGKGSGLRSGVAILRPKAHLKIYVHFIFEGVGVNTWCNCSRVTLVVLCMSAGNSSFDPLQALWIVSCLNSLNVNSLYCKKIKSSVIPSSSPVTLPLLCLPDCERFFWEFSWSKMVTLTLDHYFLSYFPVNLFLSGELAS